MQEAYRHWRLKEKTLKRCEQPGSNVVDLTFEAIYLTGSVAKYQALE